MSGALRPGERVDSEGRIWPDTRWLEVGRMALEGVVTLTDPELREALECAQLHLKRVAESRLKSRADDSKDDPVRNARLGYAGQRAFAIWLGVPWKCSVSGFKLPDVEQYEIRTSSRADLKIKGAETGPGADKDETIVVAVQRTGPRTFRIAGWIYARDGKQDRWKRDPGNRGMPAFWVPLTALRPMRELPR